MMTKNLREKVDPVNAVVAFGVWLTAAVVYLLTLAPTVSFWDCGEFIAACSLLGIPHPPGTPLYVLLGRIFSIIPWSSDIGVRVNMLSAVPSTFTAMFGYLVVVRILRACFTSDNSPLTRFLIYAGGVGGAFFLAFGLTNWNNSVETEVYGLSMMMIMAVIWLTLIYTENKGTARGERLMLLITFIGFVGIGVHMTTFLVIPVVALAFILKKDTPSQVWLALGAFFVLELYLIFALSTKSGEIPFYLPALIVLLFYLFYVFSYEKIPSVYMYVGAGFLLAVIPIIPVGLNAIMAASGSSINVPMDVFSTLSLIFFVALMLLGLFLSYKYFLSQKHTERDRHYIIAAGFVLTTAVMTVALYAIHGYHAFIVCSVVLGALLLFFLRHWLNWLILLAFALASLVMVNVELFFIGVAAGLVLITVAGQVFKLPGWRNALLIILVAVLGHSVHLFIPIRSAQHPRINENNPSQSLKATIDFIERRQYIRQSMIERMFKRRGEWTNQLGDFQRMGFWRFFSQQYGVSGPRFILLFVLGLFGIWEITRRRPKLGAPFLVLLLISSIGLVLYMNFADGTLQHAVTGGDHIEVRDRDYFFTPAFMLFGLGMGLGLTFLVQFVRELVAKMRPVVQKVIIGVSMLFFLTPGIALTNNYFMSDRSNNYMAFDYAWNILVSADENAVLFTSGDNDTFPVWCLQEAYGIRQDVVCVNLSLANTAWYIKQLRSTFGLNLSWDDREIDQLRIVRDASGAVYRLQDQVVTDIIAQNFKQRPMNFCITSPGSVRMYRGRSIDSLLSMRGMVWRMNRTGGGMRKDIDDCVALLTMPGAFQYRGIADTTVYKDPTSLRLTSNYARMFIQVADSLRNAGELERMEELMRDCVERIPYATDAINYLAAFYSQHNRRQDLIDLIDESVRYGDEKWLKTLLGRVESGLGNYGRAETILREIMAKNPDYKPPFDELLFMYYENRQYDLLRSLMEDWLTLHPDDQDVVRLMKGLDQELRRIEASGGTP